MVSRLRDMWADQTPTEIIHLLQKGVITLPRAAELMNTTSPMVIFLKINNFQIKYNKTKFHIFIH